MCVGRGRENDRRQRVCVVGMGQRVCVVVERE